MIPWPDDPSDAVDDLPYERLNRQDRPIGERLVLIFLILFSIGYLVAGVVGTYTIARGLADWIRS